jgi:hypothetical protein
VAGEPVGPVAGLEAEHVVRQLGSDDVAGDDRVEDVAARIRNAA